ncbi:MAG: hypothetical protein L6Q95_15095, partial [Planctomycetes bacterium]|nr:hypothetical protein [Planctomycetota bacterium]
MDASEILGRIGVAGFVSVFQAAAVGLGAVLAGSARESLRKGQRKDVALLSLALLFPLLFAAMPLAFAHKFNGWPGLVAQVAVFLALVGFVVVPAPPARAER